MPNAPPALVMARWVGIKKPIVSRRKVRSRKKKRRTRTRRKRQHHRCRYQKPPKQRYDEHSLVSYPVFERGERGRGFYT